MTVAPITMNKPDSGWFGPTIPDLSQRAAFLPGGKVRLVSPMEVGEVICLKGKTTADIGRLLGVPEDKVVTEGAGRVSYIARNNILTSERRDRYQDVVCASGGDFTDFLQNPGPQHGMLQLSHGMTSAAHPSIGRVANLVATKSAAGLPAVGGDFEFHSSALAVEIAQLFEGRFLRAGSIGFQPKSSASITILDERGNAVPNADAADYYGMLPEGWGLFFRLWVLLEHSVVTVPANPEALGRSMSEVRSAFMQMPNVCQLMGIDRPRVFAAYGRATFHKAACPGGHCAGCSGDYEEKPEETSGAEEEKAATALQPGDSATVSGTLVESEEVKAATEVGEQIKGSLALASAARALKDVSLETCPECMQSVAFYRPAREFITHDADGKTCSGKALPVEPTGPTAKEILRAGRVLRAELKERAACAAEDIKTILSAAEKKITESESAEEGTSPEPAATPTPEKAAPVSEPGNREAETTHALSPELVAAVAQAILS